MLSITPEHIAYKRVIGKLNKSDVWMLGTTGGLHIVCTSGSNGMKVLGAGAHKAIAKHIAEKAEPSLVWTELSKSESLDAVVLEAHLPQSYALTQKLNAMLSR